MRWTNSRPAWAMQEELSKTERGEEEDLWVRAAKGSRGKSPPLHSLCSPLSCTQCHMSVLLCYLLFGEHKGDQPQHVLCPDSLELGLHCTLRQPGWRFQMCHEISQPNSSCTNLKTHYKNSPYGGSLTRDKDSLAWNRGRKTAVLSITTPPFVCPSLPPSLFPSFPHLI